MDPNLKDPIVKLMYNATIEKHKPKLNSKKSKELLSVDDGGSSYWSYKSHRWIKGKFDKKVKNLFIKQKFINILFKVKNYLSISKVLILRPRSSAG